jgi:antitoxin component YwqK of YwqJK toxin-antitoxin module
MIMVKEKKCDMVDGQTIKYHASGKTVWSKGHMVDGQPDGYWEWFRIDGTIKRSGHFDKGQPVGTWITYNAEGKPHKETTY